MPQQKATYLPRYAAETGRCPVRTNKQIHPRTACLTDGKEQNYEKDVEDSPAFCGTGGAHTGVGGVIFTSCSDGSDSGSGKKTVAQFKSDADGMRMTFYDDKSFEIATAQAEKAAQVANFKVIITGHYEGKLTGKVTIKDATYFDGKAVDVRVTISEDSLTLKIDGVDYTLIKNGTTKPDNDGDDGNGNTNKPGSTTKPGNDSDNGDGSGNGGNGGGNDSDISGGNTTKDGYLTIVDGVVISCDKDAEGKIVIPNGVTEIQGGSFRERKGITEVVIPDSVTTIGRNAFYKCTSLEKVTIGNNVKSIGDLAFFDCSSLESVEIPDSVTTIGEEAFWQCFALKSVVIGDGVTTIGDHAFWNSRNLKSLTLGKSVETISDHAFQDCDALTNVVLPASVKTIGNFAFAESPLESLTLPDGVETIGYNAFSCSSTDGFTSIKIPASVKFIGNGAGALNVASDAKVEFAVTKKGWYYNENYKYDKEDNEEDWLPVADYVKEYQEEEWKAKPEEEKFVYLFNSFSALKRK